MRHPTGARTRAPRGLPARAGRGDPISIAPSPRLRGEGWGEGHSAASTTVRLLDVSDELQDLHRTRSELLGQLVLQRLCLLDEARLVDVLDELNADLFEPRHRLVLQV